MLVLSSCLLRCCARLERLVIRYVMAFEPVSICRGLKTRGFDMCMIHALAVSSGRHLKPRALIIRSVRLSPISLSPS